MLRVVTTSRVRQLRQLYSGEILPSRFRER